MSYSIREMRKEEYSLLSDFLYEAIYIPDGTAAPPKSVITCPELQVYIADFGNSKHDKALIVEVDGNIVGAIWARIMNDYGHIDENTPSLAMSVLKAYRGMGKMCIRDRPLTSLDVVVAEEMKQLLRSLKQDRITIFSTHIMDLALDLCDEIVLLNHGELEVVEKTDLDSREFKDKIIAALREEGNE